METETTSSAGVLEALQCACSQDPSVLKVGEERLEVWSKERGFYATLAVRVLNTRKSKEFDRWVFRRVFIDPAGFGVGIFTVGRDSAATIRLLKSLQLMRWQRFLQHIPSSLFCLSCYQDHPYSASSCRHSAEHDDDDYRVVMLCNLVVVIAMSWRGIYFSVCVCVYTPPCSSSHPTNCLSKHCC